MLALRGYLQSVQNDQRLASEQKAALVREVLPLLTRAEEKRLAIATIGSLPTAGALEVLAHFAADPTVREEACSAIVRLAARADLKDVTPEQRRHALQAALQHSQSAPTKQQAADALQAIR